MKEKKEKTKEAPAPAKSALAKERIVKVWELKFPRINWLYMIKTIFVAILFLGATVFFAHVCARVQNEYLALLMNPQGNLELWILIPSAIAALSVAAGILVTLVRPSGIIFDCFVLSAALLVELLGVNVNSLIIAVIYLVIAVSYSQSVIAQFGNQIRFTMHPLVDGNKLFLLSLVLIVSVSFALGYQYDSVNRGFVIPPEIKTAANEAILKQADDAIGKMDQNPGGEVQQAILDKAKESVDKMWTGFESQIKSIQFPLMPVMMGSLLMTTLQIIMILLGWIPLIFTTIILSLLKVTRFSKILTETREVETLMLE
jgi:hypothetical protein